MMHDALDTLKSNVSLGDYYFPAVDSLEDRKIPGVQVGEEKILGKHKEKLD